MASRTLSDSELDRLAATLRLKGGVAFSETIAPGFETTHGVPLERLAVLDAPVSGRVAELELGAVLGSGGMGQVRLAQQLPLDREVAVKALHARAPEDASQELLREARVMGALEHPNIVPVHLVGQDARGEPLVVMKRIEGQSFGRRIAEAPGDIDGHVRVLIAICNAVHYAHARGVLHRDIKPDNVMVGTFGEVYVLDWGVAVALRGEVAGLPSASSAAPAGTPRYMAPEMVQGNALDERADVYLLGATLHHVLTGSGPHHGETPIAVLRAALSHTPRSYPPPVPPELAEICNRAMHPEPMERFESALALRDALADALEHRHSAALAREAQERLDALLAAEDQETAWGEFRACRFGFEQALKTWPENGHAQGGLAAALRTMAERALDGRDHRAARRHLEEMLLPPPELVARLEAAERREADAAADAERMRQELDLKSGLRVSGGIIAALATFTLLPGPILGLLEVNGMITFGHTENMLAWGGVNVVMWPLVWRYWAQVAPTAGSRRLWRALGAACVALTVYTVIGAVLGVDPRRVATETMAVASMAFVLGGALLDRRLALPGVIYMLGYATALIFPRWMLFIFGVTSSTSLGSLAFMWLRAGLPEDPEAP